MLNSRDEARNHFHMQAQPQMTCTHVLATVVDFFFLFLILRVISACGRCDLLFFLFFFFFLDANKCRAKRKLMFSLLFANFFLNIKNFFFLLKKITEFFFFLILHSCLTEKKKI